MKKILAFLFVPLILLSCSTKPLLRAGVSVNKLPNYATDSVPSVKNFLVEIAEFPAATKAKEMSEIKTITSFAIPVPFYAFYKQKYNCILGKPLMVAYPKGLKFVFLNELKNINPVIDSASHYKLKLTVKELVFNFQYNNKGHIIVPLFFTIRIKKEFVQPLTVKMKIEYELFKNDVSVRKGEIKREKVVTDKITASSPIPDMPSYISNPRYNPNTQMGSNQSPTIYNTKADYAQLQGGTYNEAISATAYGYKLFPGLMKEVAVGILDEIKAQIK